MLFDAIFKIYIPWVAIFVASTVYLTRLNKMQYNWGSYVHCLIQLALEAVQYG
jgi:hypothetical protein